MPKLTMVLEVKFNKLMGFRVEVEYPAGIDRYRLYEPEVTDSPLSKTPDRAEIVWAEQFAHVGAKTSVADPR